MKRVFLTLLAVVLVSLAWVPALPSAAASTENPHGIEYPATPSTLRLTALGWSGTGDNAIYIDMNTERLHAPAEAGIVALHNGKKWTKVSIPADGLNISKLLNKGGIFQVTDRLDARGKDIIREAIPGEDGQPDTPASKVYSFSAIEERPKIDKYMINYAVGADKTGATPGRWMMTQRSSNNPLENTYQIATTSDRKNPDDKGWGTIPPAGVNLMPLGDGSRVVKTTYLLRIAPTETRPASKIKRQNITGQGKPLRLKADYKKEIMKVRENVAVFTGGAETLKVNTEAVVPFTKESARNGYVLSEKLGQTLAIWVAATPKKPATAPQFIHTAWRAIMPEVNQPTFTNTAVRLDTKTYEVERPDKPGTWTTSVVRPTRAGTVEYNIRAKATAKAGRENSTTFAASEPGKLVLTWGIVNEERNTMGYTDAYIVAPREYKGVVRGLTKAEPQKRVEGDSEEITLEYTINGLHTGSGTLVFKSDSKATPETNEILIVPKVEGGSDKSVSITGALVDTTLTLTVMPVQAATVTVGLEIKFGSGLHTNENPNPSETIPDNLADLNAIAKEKLYFEKMSGGRGVKITITPIEGTFEISEVVTDSGSVVRAEVKTKAVGAANLLTAANASNIGTLSISQDGVLKLSDLKGISGTGTSAAIISGNSSEWEFFTNSGPIDDKINLNDIPSESIYPMNNIKSVSHNWFLIIRYTPSSGATIHYVFKTVDDVRPQITDATYGSNTITVTFDEPLKGSSTISGFHIQQAGTPTIQPIGAGTATAGTDKVTIENVSGLSGLYILHYNPTSGDLPAEDGNGNRAAATQAYLEGTGGAAPVLQSITFGNGVDGGMPITFAIPPAATLIGNYDNEIVYVPLNAGNQPVTVTLKGTSVGNAGFTVLSSRTSNPQYYNQFNASGEALIVGLNANTYLYVRVGTNHYCFYISRKSGANGSAAASFSSAAINKDSSSVYTITLSFSGTASPIGRLSATNFSIGGGNSAGITVEAARFEKSEVTLTLGGPNLGNLNSASKLDVVYTGNQFDCILGPGGLNGKLTDQTVTVNMNKLPAPSPAPTGS